MSTPSSSVQEARVAFGRRLREIRKDSGLSARALAVLTGWHESKCSRLENGSRTPSFEDIRAYTRHCGAAQLAEDLIATARGIEGMYVEWRRIERSGLRRVQESVIPIWERTLRYRIYSSWLVPGPLQTEAYIRALLSSIRDRRRLVDDVDEAVLVRVAKQHIVYEGNHRFSVILEEAALKYRIGGSETMSGQLRHLLSVSTLPSVSLGIIPLDADRSALWPVEGFFLFDDAQANVELVSAHLTVVQPHEIALYAETFAMLAGMAVYGPAAHALISKATDALG
ncbi:helix-turn-helix domain-containing protein [Streptomyces sp. p1417]|uniref:Helix-turn-helix domain-containing protein n=1 Tax=Streptomyces typhae TaxID=2681492 RepID=A0A6L6WVS3_9ACTN|nr:helix-turn-helix transcriptional regulator [Streptomyces typhae]MVO85887.1 helix-turn-helix domain-containing protein [Streptomyces typhae]